MPNHTGTKKCSKCGTRGHQANTCQRGAVTRPSTPRAAAPSAVGRVVATPGSRATADGIRQAIATREREIAALRATLTILGESA